MPDTNEYINELLEELESIDISTYNPREKVLRDRISEIRLNEREGAKKAYIKVARSLLRLNMSEMDILNNIKGLSDYLSLEDLEKIKIDLVQNSK